MEFFLGKNLDSHVIKIDWDVQKRVGILLSGGLDSAVLLAAFLHAAKKTKQALNITAFSIKKADNSVSYVPKIINKLNNEYGFNMPDTTLVGDGSLQHSVINKHAIIEIFEKKLCDHLYLGLNQNPPENLPGLAPDRPKTMSFYNLHAPLLPLYKNHILELAIQLGREDLFKITHTCTEQKSGRCGVCWHCHERAWAFRQIEMPDPGMD